MQSVIFKKKHENGAAGIVLNELNSRLVDLSTKIWEGWRRIMTGIVGRKKKGGE